MDIYNVIIVGDDNLTRSIVAEAALKKVLREREIANVEVISRGTVVLFSEPISPKAAAVLHEHECDSVSKRSTELSQQDLDQADLVLAVGKKDVDSIKEKFNCQTTCMFLGTFIDMEEEVPMIEEDTREAYEKCYQVCRQAMEAAADRLILELMTSYGK